MNAELLRNAETAPRQGRTPPPTLVFGTGVSGRAVERLARVCGGAVRFADEADPVASVAAFVEAFPTVVKNRQAVAAMSPGIPPSGPEFAAARSAGLVIRGELSIGADWFKGRTIAVTGSKGKSSVVKFIADALRSAGFSAEPCGNYGRPLSDVAAEDPQPAFAALECSSFQLETEDGALHPETAILLNFSRDHLDRHRSLEAYLAAKLNLFSRNATHALLPRDPPPPGIPDPVAAFQRRFPGRTFETFGASPRADWRWTPGEITDPSRDGRAARRIDISGSYFDNEVLGPGLAAATAALLRVGLPPEVISGAARTFEPLPHRMQRVAHSASGSEWIDNSKATNLAALAASCRMASAKPVILLAGGRIKEPLWLDGKHLVDSGVRFVYTFGECGPSMASLWRPALPVDCCETLEKAVAAAAAAAATLGPCSVLLAPGTASFDQFRSYAERGERFAAAARRHCSSPPLSRHNDHAALGTQPTPLSKLTETRHNTMKSHFIPSANSTVALCAAMSALCAGCFTSRTSLFGNYPNSSSPRAPASAPRLVSSSQPRPTTQSHPQLQPQSAPRQVATVPPPYPVAAARPAQPAVTPHGTPLPPTPATTRPPARLAPPPTQGAPVAQGWRIHEVQPGEVVGRLANDNGMSIAEFCEVNGISDPNRLRVGQKVKIATGRQRLGPGKASGSTSTTAAIRDAHTAPAARTASANHTTAHRADTPPPPPKKEQTGSTSTDVDALLRGGSLAAQREAAREQAAKAEAERAAKEEQARKAAAEAKAKADEEAARARKAADEEAKRLAELARAEEEKSRRAAEAAAEAARREAEAAVAPQPAPQSSGDGLYTVAAGDDIYSISLKFETTPLELRRLNGGKSLTGLQPGDRISVPRKGGE